VPASARSIPTFVALMESRMRHAVGEDKPVDAKVSEKKDCIALQNKESVLEGC